jgi:hypothetical protein
VLDLAPNVRKDMVHRVDLAVARLADRRRDIHRID